MEDLFGRALRQGAGIQSIGPTLGLFSPQARILFCRKLLETVEKAFGQPGSILRVKLQSGVFEFVDAHNEILPPQWTAGQGGPTFLRFTGAGDAQNVKVKVTRPSPRPVQPLVGRRSPSYS